MFRRTGCTRSLLVTAVTVLLPVYAGAVSFQVESVDERSIEVRFALELRDEKQPPPGGLVTFGFTTQPGLTARVSIRAAPGGSSLSSMPVRTICTAHAGGEYLQWISFSPYRSSREDPIVLAKEGLLRIEYPRPIVAVSPDNEWRLRANVLHVPLVRAAAKAAAPARPHMPFRVGIRIEISADGIYEISARQLAALGVPVGKVPSRFYRLFERTREVPIYITNPHRTHLHGDDKILFYGRFLRGENSYYTQYSATNVYWLTWDTGRTGARIAEVSGAQRIDERRYLPGGEKVSIAAREFYDTLHVEYDSDIRWLGDVFDPQEPGIAPLEQDQVDNWYWGTIGKKAETQYHFKVPSPSTDQSENASVRIGMTGLTSRADDRSDHDLQILLNGDSPSRDHSVQRAQWDGQTDYIYQSPPFPVSMLEHGVNTLTFLRGTKAQDESALNWIEIVYPRTFRALDNQILFRNNARDVGGVFQFTVRGFGNSRLELWDVRNNRVFTDFTVRQQGDSVDLVFQDTCATVNHYLAQTIESRLEPAALTLDTISDSWEFPQGVDYLIVAPERFFEELEPLAETHRARGLTVAMIDIDDIYNSFSYGVKNPESIRAMLSYIFARHTGTPPRYLLLCGDTSHDLDKNRRSLNIVPTHLSRVPGWGPCSDDGYLATVHGSDNFPDLLVGRFPARNTEDVRTMVAKTVRYIRNPHRGFWRDNLLLAGGREQDFTVFNNYVSQHVVRPTMHILRMDAYDDSPYYHNELIAARSMADFINSGVYAINFNGHGGGLIWSDSRFFSYTDFNRLYNSQWSNGGKLPIVFSFTCLTGFFESVFYRSLGEEFLRKGLDGAACFYGASAYTSKNGNLIMNRILLEKAMRDEFETVGELLWHTEMEMLVRFDAQHLPLIRQYNLLGDPALPWKLTPDSLGLSLNKAALEGRDTLRVTGTCAPVRSGKVKLRVGSGPQEWESHVTKVDSQRFTASFPLKQHAKTADGWVRAYAWNDSAEVRAWRSFSKDSLLVHDVRISPAHPAFGDSVRVSCRIDTPSHMPLSHVLCLYATTSATAEPADTTGVLLVRDSTGAWATPAPLHLDYSGEPDEALVVKFRVVGSGLTKESARFVFPVRGRADLEFTGQGLTTTWSGESLYVDFEILNAGNVGAAPFSVTFTIGPDTVAVVQCSTSLAPGRTCALRFALPDTTGTLTLVGQCNADRKFTEISHANNMISTELKVAHADLQQTGDTLWSPGGGLALSPPRGFDQPYRVVLLTESINDSQPLLTESQWVELRGDSVAQFKLGVRPPLGAQDSLLWTFVPTAAATKQRRGAPPRAAAVTTDTVVQRWRHAAEGEEVGGRIVLRTVARCPLALARITDAKPPDIRVSVHGRELRFLDYAAKNKPFSIFMADPSGILPSAVEVSLNSVLLDTSRLSAVPLEGDLTSVTLTAYPAKQLRVDSLTVRATDFAGNSAENTFAYWPGEDLRIKFLSCHPNPFSAKQNADGESIQRIRFAFLLTDIASKVRLSIHTIGGRKIKAWTFLDLIGYQEIEWDGKTEQGFRIANGTYYAKLTARNDRKATEKIIRIAKLEGY